MNKEFIIALEELEKSKNVDKKIILEALEKALVKSYQKNYENNENVDVNIDEETGEIEVYSLKNVVDEVNDPIAEISKTKAREIDSKLDLGDICRVKIAPKNFGRVAAQTARNIVLQKIRDAQRDSVYSEYLDRANEIITGVVQREDKYNVYINLDKIEGIIPLKEQVENEKYIPNQRIKVLIKDVKNTTKEPQIILSRKDKDLVVRLFELEVPEITNGIIEIYGIDREAGSRTKIAVFSNDPEIDSIGACIGFKGSRVNSIVEELQGEKIDIINYDKDIKTFIKNSLSPAEINEVYINDMKKQSLVVVREDQLSLAIGKEGQNARLAARLTGWKIDIKSQEEFDKLDQEEIDEILGLNEEEDEIIENIDGEIENSLDQVEDETDFIEDDIENLSEDLDQIIKEDIEKSEE
ncbi:transcription termination factor NusA [Anaerococcus hydrogenalis]|uniref:Transcription termination/antitermination protein NusA n=1 Tax=Anaerococcus hydrogenalis TaxID=33029 RepID=A0A2N6UKA1_9FIRM|nr:transcription termination factor NusA [Anaerococcus hydrogenalis]MBS5988802.1 transcription termination/antitermination protein NusA [Anaerococcus hydrogenalis]MDK7694235.1 transcription termination factor NusA [Anaerococcus hydrogenalis]MDK7696013.1 transcription termination factor NusA [Anaerococcus hydrogenalis]MDK7707262.1 transcription termination factor NusA [Anaerococcus hydrogenalis]PMC82288.1 transcription termination/antitermination protein NusA [Anaerococcus hydrogenalis]